MKKIIVITFLMISFWSHENVYAFIVNSPENPKLFNPRLSKLTESIPFLDYSKLPEPKSYSESGVNDLVFLGLGLREKFGELRTRLNKDMLVTINEKETCKYLVCPKNYRYNRRIKKMVYQEATHIVVYSTEDEKVLGLRVRYSPYYSKFHIMGYFSPSNK